VATAYLFKVKGKNRRVVRFFLSGIRFAHDLRGEGTLEQIPI